MSPAYGEAARGREAMLADMASLYETTGDEPFVAPS